MCKGLSMAGRRNSLQVAFSPLSRHENTDLYRRLCWKKQMREVVDRLIYIIKSQFHNKIIKVISN